MISKEKKSDCDQVFLTYADGSKKLSFQEYLLQSFADFDKAISGVVTTTTKPNQTRDGNDLLSDIELQECQSCCLLCLVMQQHLRHMFVLFPQPSNKHKFDKTKIPGSRNHFLCA